MTHEEFNSLSEADQDVAMQGYSSYDREDLMSTPIWSTDSYGEDYIWDYQIFFYDHYTGTYWTQNGVKEEAQGPLVFGPVAP